MQAFLVKLILSIVGKIFRSSKPTMTEGAGAGETESRLRTKLKEEGWK